MVSVYSRLRHPARIHHAPPKDGTSPERPVTQKKRLLRKGLEPSPLNEKRRQAQLRQQRLQQKRDVEQLNELQRKIREAQAQLARRKQHVEEQCRRRKKEMRKMVFEYLPSSTIFSTTLPKQSPDLVESSTRIGSYHIGKLLGQGGYGKVYEATRVMIDRRTGMTRQVTFALKKIEKRRMLTPRKLEDLNRELFIMKQIHHPNVIRCYKVLNGRDHIHVVLNKAAMDLFDYKVKHHLTDGHLKVIMQGILKGIKYLHTRGISHFDIKSENVLVLRNVPPHKLKVTDVQLCDFGLAVQQEDPNSTPVRGRRGTFGFMAPELITTEKAHGHSADMWSFGVTLLEFVLGGMPSRWPMDPKSDLEDYMERMMDCLEQISYQMQQEYCASWDLVSRLVRWVPHNRLTAMEALEHHWFQEVGADNRDEALISQTRQQAPGRRQGW